MWCRWGKTIAAVGFGVTAGLVSYEFATVAQSQIYTPSQFRAFLMGFGYNVQQTEGKVPTEVTRQAIRDFQKQYGIKVDGIAGTQTQQLAAAAVKNLQGSLNLVVKPTPLLPRDQFYGSQTAAVVKQFQKQEGLPVTGIATLEVRSRLDQEARKALGETSSPSTTPSTSPSPSMLPSTTPSTSPSPSMSPSMRPSASPSPSMSPSRTPSPSTSP